MMTVWPPIDPQLGFLMFYRRQWAIYQTTARDHSLSIGIYKLMEDGTTLLLRPMDAPSFLTRRYKQLICKYGLDARPLKNVVLKS